MKIVKLMGCCFLICFLAGCSAQSYEDARQVEKMTLDELKENKNQELSKIQNSYSRNPILFHLYPADLSEQTISKQDREWRI